MVRLWDEIAGEVRERGYGIVEGALDPRTVERYTESLFRAQDRIIDEIGQARLERARSYGDPEIRLPMAYDHELLDVFAEPALLTAVDEFLGPHAILRFQNGFIQGSLGDIPFRHNTWHQNFPVWHNGYRVALDIVYFLVDVTETNGPLHVIPGSHRSDEPPLDRGGSPPEPVVAPAGAMLVLDSNTWHQQTSHRSGEGLVYLSLQFVRPYMKPHFDHVRALGSDVVAAMPERTRQFLGWTTRVPASLDEFYVEPEERTYRAGQW